MRTIRLGTRASALATTQSRHVADLLTAATGATVELVPIVSYGDVATGSLASLGGTGVFAAALREALLRGECDVVVHSMKDLPTAAHPGLSIGGIPARERQNDVLCATGGRALAALPPGARVGTGSPRRAAQVRRVRPDLVVVDIRGNVDTRLRRVAAGEYDAIVLAEAGLRRIGRTDEISEVFPLEEWPTSAAQGALAVELRQDDLDGALGEALRSITDPVAAATALLEREVLALLEAGCTAPIAVSATAVGGEVRLHAEVYSADGREVARARATAPLAALIPVPAHPAPAALIPAPLTTRARVATAVATTLLAEGATFLAEGASTLAEGATFPAEGASTPADTPEPRS
ncbi:hydroxymethylbilane synthase [Microbacterium sp.]|uniref:hydroxymethylbilane synthase n=1 Tax=Microbacterium sp. TaxID=51671 RepID=UPI0039E440D3